MKSLVEYINENWFTSLLGTGTDVKYLISKIKNGLTYLQKEKSDTIWAKIDPLYIKYDEKNKQIIYTNEVDGQTGLSKGKSILKDNGAFKITKTLSEGEIKKFWEIFNNTKLGKEIIAASPEFKAEQQKKQKEEAAKNAKDPIYQGKELARVVAQYYEREIWKDTNKSQWKQYYEAMMKIVQKFGSSNSKFVKAYEEAIEELSKKVDKLKSNFQHVETYEKFAKETLHDLDEKIR